jgi:hypothetical protein
MWAGGWWLLCASLFSPLGCRSSSCPRICMGIVRLLSTSRRDPHPSRRPCVLGEGTSGRTIAFNALSVLSCDGCALTCIFSHNILTQHVSSWFLFVLSLYRLPSHCILRVVLLCRTGIAAHYTVTEATAVRTCTQQTWRALSIASFIVELSGRYTTSAGTTKFLTLMLPSHSYGT